ncbi:glucosaminidase domain-containing protein [Candidatus Daviesbacteria bacterium]|nr:glucosaminidase domain-containing protein [Candidatus Daviesbacteria bacterium]
MSNKIILSALLSLIFITLPISTAESLVDKKQEIKFEAKKLDNRAIVLKDYLEKHNSPLQYHSQDFIDAADTYHLDWKLVPAIAGVESTFGKAIPGGYNGWGWGVYGNQALEFESWNDGIHTVSQGLKENYVNRGLTTPAAMNRVYAASPTWGNKVNYFMNDIEKYAKSQNYSGPEELPVKYSSPEAKTAAISAKLTLKP